jgi:hypothetical protein
MDNGIVQGVALVGAAITLLLYVKRRRTRKASEQE